MIRKSKFRMTKKTSQKSKSSTTKELPLVSDILYLRLSPETQEYVQCRIGEQIFGDNNWVLVSKAAILASIEFSNDFHSAIDLVHDYPENQMLIGSYGFDQTVPEEFQLCTTVLSKNNTLAELESRRNRIAQIFDMPIYAWTSLGSEIEVIGMQNFNLRTLLVVEIDSTFPIFIGKRTFSIRAANDAAYVECFTNRHEYKNVWRKRVDAASQACAVRKNAFVQTRTTTNLRHYTEYEQQVCVETPDNGICNRILGFLESHMYDVENLLQINYHIHLHMNDYENFLNPYIPHVYTNYKEIVACQDIKKCQGKQVSCVSWNPFISGLFAASYVRTSFDHINRSEPIYEDSETFGEHVTLVWSFSNMQKPKLYLHSLREVTNISFCPYDENILVGGCSNGQIVIWDIKGHLSKVENKEVLTPKQRDNQLKISNLILWMKKLPSVGHVNACVFSSLQFGHKTAITNISWIPPEYYISTTGQYTKSMDDNLHMQFVTSSLEDDHICVWDLKHYHYVKKQTRRKPLQRLSKIPPALHKDDSPLKKKHAFFIPIFMLLVKESYPHKHLHITSMLLKNHEYNYQKLRSIQVENNFERIHFKLLPSDALFDWDQSLVVNTVAGMLYDCTWEGFSYDHGNKVNFDSCLLKSYVTIHDAPIKMCIANPIELNIFLSIGGKVFAIWQKGKATPILWRKCASNYIFGKWSQAHPFEILLFTNDGFIQLWNFFVNSKYPTYIVRSHGMPSVGIYSNVGVEHYLKNAILLFDRFGAIRIHTAGCRLVAKSVHSFETHESIRTFIETKQQVQNCVAFWSNRLKKKQCASEETKKENIEPAVKFEDAAAKKEEITKKEKFEQEQHVYMYEQLTQCKGIQLKQLEMNRKILDEVIAQSNELGRKCANALSNKAELFEKKKRLITWDASKLERRIFKISLPKDKANYLKKQYFDDYLLLEQQYRNQIQEYKYVFDWNRVEQCKLSKRLLSVSRNKHIHNNQSPMIHQAINYNFRDTVMFKTVDLYDS